MRDVDAKSSWVLIKFRSRIYGRAKGTDITGYEKS